MDHTPEIICWNVRGLNNPAKRKAVKEFLDTTKINLVCLQETKMEVVTLDIVRHCLGYKFGNFFYLPASGTRGGILLAWDELIVRVSNPHYTDYTLTALVVPVEGPQWWLTGVYGP